MHNVIGKAVRAAALAVTGIAFMASSAWAEPCAPGKAAHEYADWQWIENNAARTADSYAAERQPMATYIHATTEVVFLEGRDGYFVYLENTSSTGAVSTAILQPNFDFCDDPGKLNDSDPTLLTVVQGTFNGQPF